MVERYFFVIVYDIVDNKRRNKVAKKLESLGERVQYSVFESYLTKIELNRLLDRLTKLIDNDSDSVRVYNLCSACRAKVHSIGQGRVTPEPDVIII